MPVETWRRSVRHCAVLVPLTSSTAMRGACGSAPACSLLHRTQRAIKVIKQSQLTSGALSYMRPWAGVLQCTHLHAASAGLQDIIMARAQVAPVLTKLLHLLHREVRAGPRLRRRYVDDKGAAERRIHHLMAKQKAPLPDALLVVCHDILQVRVQDGQALLQCFDKNDSINVQARQSRNMRV